MTFTARVSGTVDGTKFNDIRVSAVTMPLDQDVYTLSTKFEKNDKKQVLTKDTKSNQELLQTAERVGAVVAMVLGVIAIMYGSKKQIFKSDYQRKLDKIYRYHDEIIIKASEPVNLHGKHVVVVQSFDDLLNIEEEMKVPIVASRISDEATRFTITHNNDAYAYTLGRVLIDEDRPESAAEFSDADLMTGKNQLIKRPNKIPTLWG